MCQCHEDTAISPFKKGVAANQVGDGDVVQVGIAGGVNDAEVLAQPSQDEGTNGILVAGRKARIPMRS